MKVLLGIKEQFGNEGRLEAIAEKYGCELVFKPQDDWTHEDMKDALAVFGNPPLAELYDLPQLKLVQLQSAGADQYAASPFFAAPGAPALCNTSGAYGRTIAEAIVAFFLSFARQYPQYRDFMQNHEWHYLGAPDIIGGKKVLIIGLGDIGLHLAKLLDAFGCEIYAVKRTKTGVPECIKEVYTLDELDNVLPDMDYVSLSLPNTPDTRHVIDAARLKLMKPTAVLVNVGRGPAVDNLALAEALSNGEIYGAGLDVTEPEPLPADHPLWDCKNCFITPHSSGMFFQRDPHCRIMNFFAENMEALFTGGEFINVVNIKERY